MKHHPLFEPPATQQTKAGKVRLEPGESIGEHVTEHREEIIIVLSGTATITANGQSTAVRAGNTYFIPVNTTHNVTNRIQEPIEYIYVVTHFPHSH